MMKNRTRLLKRVFAAAAAVILLQNLVCAAIVQAGFWSGRYQTKQLTVTDFALSSVELTSGHSFVTVTNDPQLIYTGDIVSLQVKCTYSVDPGEVVVFYSSVVNGGFSPEKMLHAKQENGYYCFTFPLGTKQIRFDPAAFEKMTVTVEECTVNAKSAAAYGLRTADLFTAVLVPAVLCFVLDTGLNLWDAAAQRRAKKR